MNQLTFFSTILLVLLVCTEFCIANRDFYKILNIKKSANTNEVKKAYRKLAKELHPDKVRKRITSVEV